VHIDEEYEAKTEAKKNGYKSYSSLQQVTAKQ
jgi:hypothetical protein